jgi:hypothetical protein
MNERIHLPGLFLTDVISNIEISYATANAGTEFRYIKNFYVADAAPTIHNTVPSRTCRQTNRGHCTESGDYYTSLTQSLAFNGKLVNLTRNALLGLNLTGRQELWANQTFFVM